MTTIDQRTQTPADVLAAAQALAGQIRERAGEIEEDRRVPRDLLDLLVHNGCFRLLLPTSHGGIGAELSEAMRVLETLARADASVGWTVMIGGGGWFDLVGLPRPSFDALFEGRTDVVFAGAFNPTGQIEPVDGGYRVRGRWAFASGCEHADWLFGNCIEGFADGMPLLRCVVLAPDQVTIEDTWRAIGLRGTGSHHFHVDDVVLPADRTFDVLAEHEPCIDETIAHIPPPTLFASVIATVALGIAQGALDDITALAADRMPLLAGAPLAASGHFHAQLATADTEVRAARALLYETADSLWATAAARGPLSLEDRARVRATAVWVTDRATAAVEMAYRAGGSAALYSDCTLQRRLRDIHALQQHFLVRQDTMVTAGSLLAGQDLQIPIF